MHQELGNRSILKMTELGVPVAISVIATFTWCVALSIFISMKIEPPMRAAILRVGSSAKKS
jgi:hypothetical protein